MIESFGITDKGKVRPNNEDNFLILVVRKSIEVSESSLSATVPTGPLGSSEAHLFVVADGVGGGPDGDRASADTIAAVLSYVKEAAGCFHKISAEREHELFGQLESTVQTVHHKLVAEHGGEPGSAPATTLTMVLLAWPRAYFIHVGDGSELMPVVGLIDLDPGDCLLLCTDGLTRHVDDERIAAVLNQNGPARAAVETLLADALAGGGKDNITLIVVNTR